MPFPELTQLRLKAHKGPGPILLDSFLGGTTPRLQSLQLYDVTFPRLPRLLLLATHLVHLVLDGILRPGYIPPEAMATSFSALTSLESLCPRFRYTQPRSTLDSRRPPPTSPARSILPRLT